jgi:dTDP-4-dehydrorhamnose reductase
MKFADRSIVVTGSEGQLGTELCRQLGAAAIGLPRSKCNLLDAAGLTESLAHYRPTIVINTAAYTAVDRAESEQELCNSVNADGVASLAKVCRQLDCVLVQVSTDYVFGGDAARSAPYRETDKPNPVNIYGHSKLAGERHAATWHKHFIVRTCGLYGPRSKETQSNFVDTMLRLGRERDRLRIVDDQICSPSYTVDVAKGILTLARTQAHGTYHLVNEGAITWYEFANEIFRQAGLGTRTDRITTCEYGAAAQRPAYSVLDASKYNAIASPLRSWNVALAEYLQRFGKLTSSAGKSSHIVAPIQPSKSVHLVPGTQSQI